MQNVLEKTYIVFPDSTASTYCLGLIGSSSIAPSYHGLAVATTRK